MGRSRAMRKRDLRELGWKALVEELGVTDATRFIRQLSEGEQNYAALRQKLYAGKSLDSLYAEIRAVHPGQRTRR